MSNPKYSLKRYRKYVIPVIVLVLLAQAAAMVCGATFDKLAEGIVNGIAFFRFLAPPDWSAFPQMIEPALQSVLIAFLGTVFGTLLAIVFALLAASNISNKWVRMVARFLIGFERSVPEIVILLLLIAAFGLGAMPGIICLALGCVGMIGKLLADVIEELDPLMIDAIDSVGAHKLQVIGFGVMPQIMPNLISYALYRFEINIRLSVILGAVGAGGIGYEVDYAFNMLQYHRAFTGMLVIIIMVFIIERISYLLLKNLKTEGVLK